MPYIHRTIKDNIIKTGKSFPCPVAYVLMIYFYSIVKVIKFHG